MRACLAAVLLFGCASPPPPVPYGFDGAPPPITSPSPIGGSPHRPGGTPAGDCEARVLVVFDRSSSMSAEWSGGEPRWRVAADALADGIEPLADRLVVGALLFPGSDLGELSPECAPVAGLTLTYRRGDSFLSAWESMWSSPPALYDSTPLDSAFDAADAALPRDDTLTVVVLLTDGAPTCEGPVPAREHAASWRTDGIRTFVVGLPGAHGSAYLDAIASSGDTGSALDVSDPALLTARLEGVLSDALDQACAR